MGMDPVEFKAMKEIMLLKCYGEFSWLPSNFLKGITLPLFYFLSEEEIGLRCSGCYRTFPNSNKIPEIFIDPELEELVPSSIAHEFMHHIQFTNGLTMEEPRVNYGLPYEAEIARFFKTSKIEYEALLFQNKIAKDWLCDWWLNKLVAEY